MARSFLLVVLAAAAVLCVPVWGDPSTLNILGKVLVAGLFAMSFNLLWGQAGLLSFGQAAYFGLGAFAAMFAMRAAEHGAPVPLPFIPLIAGVAGLCAGLVAGWFATMRSGIYFAMITFAIDELVSTVTYQWDAVFGGEAGVRARRSDWLFLKFQSTESVYYLTVFWLLACLLALWWLRRSPFGNVMKGLREREDRIAFIGYDTHLVKTVTFAIAAFFAGLAGGLLAITDEAANVSIFASQQSTNVVLNTIIGGTGTFFGPMLGAAFTTLFGYNAASYTAHWTLYLGVIFVLVVMLAPRGLLGLLIDAAQRRGPRLSLNQIAARIVVAIAFVLPTILLVEIVGATTSSGYAVARRAVGGSWPPVRIFGMPWVPNAPATILAIVLGYAVVIVVQRSWITRGRPQENGLPAAGAGAAQPETGS